MGFVFESGGATRSFRNLPSNGDAVVTAEKAGVQLYAVVDALGHGPDAEKSAQAVTKVLVEHASLTLAELFSRCDQCLAGLRQVVMGVVQIFGNEARFAGVGNIELYSPAGHGRPAAASGTVGGGIKRLRELPLSLAVGQRWTLVSDGMQARKMEQALEKVSMMTAPRAARELLALAAREEDDASVLVFDVLDVRGAK